MNLTNAWNFTKQELAILTSNNKLEHPLDSYRRQIPDSKRTTQQLLNALKHKDDLQKKLDEIIKKETTAKITPPKSIKTDIIKKVIDDDELRIIIEIKNELKVIESQLQELLIIQTKTYELFKKIDSSKSHEVVDKKIPLLEKLSPKDFESLAVISQMSRDHATNSKEICEVKLEGLLTFHSDIVPTLPAYYRACIRHLVDTGRAVIVDSPEQCRDNPAILQ